MSFHGEPMDLLTDEATTTIADLVASCNCLAQGSWAARRLSFDLSTYKTVAAYMNSHRFRPSNKSFIFLRLVDYISFSDTKVCRTVIVLVDRFFIKMINQLAITYR